MNEYNKTIKLPSGGILYGEGSLLKSGEIVMKDFSYGDQVKLNAISTEKDLYNLLDDQIVSPKGISLRELLPQDFFYMLVSYRAYIFGDKYTPSIQCPKCQEYATGDISLESVVESSMDLVEEPDMDIELSDGKVLTLKLLTMEEDDNVRESAKRRARKFGTGFREELYKGRHLASIALVDGEEMPSREKEILLKGLSIRDIGKIDDFVRRVDFGIDSSYEITCQFCGKKSVVDFPISVEFFRTTSE